VTNLSELKKEVTIDLNYKILKLISARVGAINAMKKAEIMTYCPGYTERAIRLSISKLRKDGVLIGSTNSDGYFMCGSLAEYLYVKDTEMMARVKDILETVSILDKAAREKFGDAVQEKLF
jgi:hypothetical protein